MADQEARTRIVIETDAELAGAEAAAESMERDIGRAKALGKSYDDLSAQLKVAKDGIADYRAQQEAAATSTAKVTDENERYQKSLAATADSIRQENNAALIAQLRQEAEARRSAAEELDAYDQKLQQMASRQGQQEGETGNTDRQNRIVQLRAESEARRVLAEHLAENSNATKALGAENISLAQYNQDSLNPAIAEYKKNLGEATEEVERHAANHRALHQLFHQADELLPGLGSAFKAAFATTPLVAAVAAIAAVIGGFEIYKRRVDELVASLGGLELPDLSPPDPTKINEYVKVLHAMNDAILDAKEAYNSVSEASDRYVAKLKIETDQQKRLLEGRKAVELAALEQNKAHMSADQYAATKNAIDNRYAQAGISVDDKTQNETVAEMNRKAVNLQTEAARKRAEAAAIHVSADDGKGVGDIQAQNDAARKNRDDARARQQQLNAFRDKSFLDNLLHPGEVLSYLWKNGLQRGSTTLKQQGDREKDSQRIIDDTDAQLKQKQERDHQRARRDQLEKSAADDEAAAEKTRLGIPDAEQAEARDKQFRQAQQTQTEAASVIGTELGQKILEAAKIANEYFEHRKPGEIKQLPPEQEALLLEMFNQLTGRNVRPGELPPGQVGGAAGVFRTANQDPARLVELYNRLSASDTVKDTAQTADILKLGGTASDQSKTILIQVANLLTGHTNSLQGAINYMSKVNDKIDTFNAAVAAFTRQLGQMKTQFDNRISKSGP